jgi:amino acid transporter
MTTDTGHPSSLVRALGVGDLTWLYLVAVVNLNIVPVIAAEGRRAMWLWTAVVLCFFLPQGIAVIELAARMPGEGGLYLWTKQTFGDFHGFLCGWCYWMTNIFFVPTLLLSIGGILSYIGGPAAAGLAENRAFFLSLTLALLWLTVAVNIRGLGAGKWINNVGGIGALIIACVLMGLALSLAAHGFRLPPAGGASFLSEAPWSTLGVMCLALVGLEIGPVMGDEIRDPRRTIRRGVLLGGLLCAAVYLGSTASLIVAIPQTEMKVVQGVLQAIDKLSIHLGAHWILLPLALLLAASIAGSTSAWVSGSARILFVCGVDRYLPKALGATHPRYGSPHFALGLFGVLTSAILGMSFIGATVKEAYVTLLDLSVALQMIAYAYLFLTLVQVAFSRDFVRASFPPLALRVSSIAGLTATLFALAMAFVPSRQIESVRSFELKMVCAVLFFLALARVLFAYYSGRAAPAAAESPEVTL